MRSQILNFSITEDPKEEYAPEMTKDIGDIEVLEIELNNLPAQTQTEQLKKDLFKGEHVVALTTEGDHLKGVCNGKGKAQVRCKKLQSNDLLERLYRKGISF